MGRYSVPLSPPLADFAGIAAGADGVLDVGCGPGALTAELVGAGRSRVRRRVDPSEPFVAAARERYPDVDVRQASAEDLPFPDRLLRRRACAARRPVHDRPGRGRRRDEARHPSRRCRRRVRLGPRRRPGAAQPVVGCRARARPDGRAASRGRSARSEGDLARLFASVGLRDVEETALSVERQAPDLRGMVGAVHARRRPGRRLRRGPRDVDGPAARALPRAAPPGTVHAHRARLGGARPGVRLERFS